MEKQNYFFGTGRRKTAVAQVRLFAGDGGPIIVNDFPYKDVFPRLAHREAIIKPFLVTDTLDKYRVMIKVEGGGISGQSEAISHGIARALVRADESFRTRLREYGLLTRDPRAKERKKPGFRRARKVAQSPKR
ncbi:30S ribosomal protein S9 [Chloroflexota bacterium]